MLVTHTLWLYCGIDLQILLKCRFGWEVSKLSYPIMFEDNKIKGNLRDERGNGWHAAINGPSEVG